MKNELGRYMDAMRDISARYTTSAPDLADALKQIPHEMDAFVAYMPVIGIFNAGKSSLLNMWLGQDILPEDQQPTTALATELRYGPTQAMHICMTDGTLREIDCFPKTAEEANAPHASEGLYAVCTCGASRLQALRGIIPVDMPGTDSGIKRHLDAFYRYANRGAAFLIVVPAESGTLPDSLAAVIAEITAQKLPVILVISKCDKYLPQTVEDVEKELVACLENLGCSPMTVVRSARGDAEAMERLQVSLMLLNAEQLKTARFAPEAASLCQRLKEHIFTRREGCTLDLTTLDAKIRMYAQAAVDLDDALARQKTRLSTALRQSTLERVSGDVHNALMRHLDELYLCLQQGEDVFQARIAAIVNDVYRDSLNKALSLNLADILKDIEANMTLPVDEIGRVLQQGTMVTITVLKTLQKISKSGKWYKITSTALAVTTSVIAPIVELLIIFLPDIINLFSNPEERKREAVCNAMVEQVFPKVRNQVRQTLQEKLPDIEQELLRNLEEEWRTRIEENMAALEQCRTEKQVSEHDWQQQLDAYAHDLDDVRDIASGLQALLTP
ncbi:MAG: dynamin family protein [Chlorobium sp.]|nr:dynamin family protein [Chlorobium sp.]